MNTATLGLFCLDDHQFQLRLADTAQRVYFQSTPLSREALQPLFDLTQSHYRVKAPDLKQQGRDLFNWFNQHTQGRLAQLRQASPALALSIEIQVGENDLGLRHLPWELLHDGKQFWCADALHLFTPIRLASEHRQDWQPAKRPLQVLFMASSPEDVQPVLDFEAEEAGILRATEQKPLVLHVEESGSLQGLEECLLALPDAPDVLHLSGHAQLPANSEAVFLLENDEGWLAPATAAQLAKVLIHAERVPRLLFLSGCETGKADMNRDVLSFAERLVQAQVPVVLGWALPVGDAAASQAAAVLYEKLANGLDMAKAVAAARQFLFEQNSPYWHLLRCFANRSALNPLIAKGNIRFVPPAVTQQAFLDAGNTIAVCKRENFVGRRRLLQRSLRQLRTLFGYAGYGEGILLHGMGGLGKSSTAARLVERLSATHLKAVHYGRLDEISLLASLRKALNPQVHTLLDDPERSLYARLYALFQPEANAYCDKPLVIVLDDFEQNIPKAQREHGKVNAEDYEPQSLQVLHTVLQAIHATYSDVRVIITCRHAVPIAAPYVVHEARLTSLRDAELAKKLKRMTGFQQATPTHRTQAITLADGNPRLLEWLDQVLLNPQIAVDELFARLQAEALRFREAILLQALVDAQSRAVRRVIALTALYRVPVPVAAVQALHDDPHTEAYLAQAVNVGLVEQSEEQGQAHYFVSSLLDTALAGELQDAEREVLQAAAAQTIHECWGETGTEAQRLEVVRLAITGKLANVAVEVGHRLAFTMRDQNRWAEAESLCQQILQVSADFRIFTTLAQVQQRLGKGEAAKAAIERAVSTTPPVEHISDALRRERALSFGAYADILEARGQLDEALRIRTQEQMPVYEQLGEVREIAITKGQIADILQARGQLDEALRIRTQEQMPVYEQLGEVRSIAITKGQIADILQARGQLDEALRIRTQEQMPVYEQLGEVREIAITKGKIAAILQARGQLDEALRIRTQEQMPVYEQLGEVREIAITKGQIADILQARGQLDEALRIRTTDELPVYEQLGDTRALLVGRTNTALLLWQIDAEQHQAEIQNLLQLALADAKQMQIPEAEQIEGIMREIGMYGCNLNRA
jgi:tetratricopeptide (TPR) repeat protein